MINRTLATVQVVGRTPLLVLLAILTLSVSCSCRLGPLSDEKQRAVAAARKEARSRGWKEFEIGNVSFTNGHWEIWIWRVPKMPGGLATVDVTSDGKVIEFHPGE